MSAPFSRINDFSYLEEWNHLGLLVESFGILYKIWILQDAVPREQAINALGRRVKVQVFGSAYIYRRCLVRSIERAYISGWLLARRRERWRMSEIAGEEGAEGRRRRRVREGKWDTHATTSTGCPREPIRP